jgi:hypothetical protein
MPRTKQVGRQFTAQRAAMSSCAVPTGTTIPVSRPLSGLDGPLSHLLADRAKAELEFDRAKLNVEHFICACDVITAMAKGQAVDVTAFPDGVRDWIKAIQDRAIEKSTPRLPQAPAAEHVQRAD